MRRRIDQTTCPGNFATALFRSFLGGFAR